MPIFVWWAIAIAILLIAYGASKMLSGTSVAQVANSPFGYIIAIGMLVVIPFLAWYRSKGSNSGKGDE